MANNTLSSSKVRLPYTNTRTINIKDLKDIDLDDKNLPIRLTYESARLKALFDKRAGEEFKIIEDCKNKYEISYNKVLENLIRNFVPSHSFGKSRYNKDLSIMTYVIDHPEKFIFFNPFIMDINDILSVISVTGFVVRFNFHFDIVRFQVHNSFKEILDYMSKPHELDTEGVNFIYSKIRPDTAESWIQSLTCLKHLTKYFKVPVIMQEVEYKMPSYFFQEKINNRSFRASEVFTGRNIMNDVILLKWLNYHHDLLNLDPDMVYMISYKVKGKFKSSNNTQFSWEMVPVCKVKDIYND